MDTIWALMNIIVYGFEILGIGALILFVVAGVTNGKLPKVLKIIYKTIFEFEDEEL